MEEPLLKDITEKGELHYSIRTLYMIPAMYIVHGIGVPLQYEITPEVGEFPSIIKIKTIL